MPTTETKASRAALIEAALAALPAIFRECLCPETIRYDLSLPFLWSGQAVATDGRIAVRADITEDQAEVIRAIPPKHDWSKRPPIGEYFECQFRSEPIAIDLSTLAKCEACDGTGSLKHAEKCEWCERSGPAPCQECRECGYKLHGDDDESPSVHVGDDIHLSPIFAAFLHRHGCVLFLPTDPDANRSVAFRGDGFEGVVMPLERGRYDK